MAQLYMYNGRPTTSRDNTSRMASPLWAAKRKKRRKMAKASRKRNRGK